MDTPLQISYRNFPSSEALDLCIREEVDKLEQFYDHVTSCRVLVEMPHRSKRQGKHFHVRIDVVVPGQELVVGRDPAQKATHEDPYLAVAEAFRAARRKLQAYTHRRWRDSKRRVAAAKGRSTAGRSRRELR